MQRLPHQSLHTKCTDRYFYASVNCGLSRPSFMGLKSSDHNQSAPWTRNRPLHFKKLYDKNAHDLDERQRSMIAFCYKGSIDRIINNILTDKSFSPAFCNNLLLKTACKCGHVKLVDLLLKDPRVNPSVDQNTPFRTACSLGHVKVVERLLEDGRLIPAYRINEALVIASKKGHVEVVKLIKDHGLIDPSNSNSLALRTACAHGNLEIVKLLLKDSKVDPSALENEALLIAARRGYVEIVGLLLSDHRLKLNLADYQKLFESINPQIRLLAKMKYSETVLNLRATSTFDLDDAVQGATDVIQNLARGPRLNEVPHNPPDWLLSQQSLLKKLSKLSDELIAQLQSANAEELINLKAHGELILQRANKRGLDDIIVKLLDNGIIPTDSNHLSQDLLHLAVRKNDLNLLSYLTTKLSVEPDIFVVNDAFENGQLEFGLSVMDQYNLKPNSLTVDAALRGGDAKTIKYLIDQLRLQVEPHTIHLPQRKGSLEEYYELLNFLAKRTNYQPTDYDFQNAILFGLDDFAKYLMDEFKFIPTQEALIQAASPFNIISNNYQFLNYLIDRTGLIPEAKVLRNVAARGDFNELLHLINTKNASPDKSVLDGAAIGGNIQSLLFLIQKGLVPDKATLDSAIYRGKTRIVNYLIKNYNIFPDDKSMHVASINARGNMEMINYLNSEFNIPTRQDLEYRLRPESKLIPLDNDLLEELDLYGI